MIHPHTIRIIRWLDGVRHLIGNAQYCASTFHLPLLLPLLKYSKKLEMRALECEDAFVLEATNAPFPLTISLSYKKTIHSSLVDSPIHTCILFRLAKPAFHLTNEFFHCWHLEVPTQRAIILLSLDTRFFYSLVYPEMSSIRPEVVYTAHYDFLYTPYTLPWPQSFAKVWTVPKIDTTASSQSVIARPGRVRGTNDEWNSVRIIFIHFYCGKINELYKTKEVVRFHCNGNNNCRVKRISFGTG